jgi:hypothetical protein
LNAAESAASHILETSGDSPDPIEIVASLATPAARSVLADQLWIDALLEYTLGGRAARVESQLARTLNALRQEPQEPLGESLETRPTLAPEANSASRELPARELPARELPARELPARELPAPAANSSNASARRRHWRTGLAIVLAAVTLVAVWWLPRTSEQATAAELLDAAIRSFSSRLYREYHVVLEHANRKEPNQGRLAVADQRRFFVEWLSPVGRIRAGSDGRQRWLMPPVGPVFVVAETPAAPAMAGVRQPTVKQPKDAAAEPTPSDDRAGVVPPPSPSLEAARDLEYLSLAALLARIQSRYEVDYLRNAKGQPVRDADGGIRLLAVRRGESPPVGEPEQISILLTADPKRLAVDADEIAVREVVLRFPELKIPVGPKRLTFSLRTSRPATAEDDRVFSHKTHQFGEQREFPVPWLP